MTSAALSAEHKSGAPRGSLGALSLGALGVVYGDIGTSPLYTIKTALEWEGGNATPEVALGILSLIVWTLIITTSIKYVAVVMRADNEGEGGILALLALVGADRIADGAKLPIIVLLGILGSALLYGDGVITPAISVLSAMEGLKLVAPALEKFIVPVTLAILIGLFVVQRRGTASIGRLFGPIMVIWFVVIGSLGVVNIWAAPAQGNRIWNLIDDCTWPCRIWTDGFYRRRSNHAFGRSLWKSLRRAGRVWRIRGPGTPVCMTFMSS